MNALDVKRDAGVELNLAAKEHMLSVRGEPLFVADWVELFFLHFEVPVAVLQREVPFPLDLFEGRAFVSLVSFQLERLRLFEAPTLTEAVFRRFTRSHFLNVRAYVTHRGEPGIYFMQEFLSNRLSIPFGRPVYGLPYHHAAARREIDLKRGRMELELNEAEQRRLELRASFEAAERPERCAAGSLTEFLLERYTAYTCHRGQKRRFRIWHPPWQQRAVEFQVADEGLLGNAGGWFAEAELMGGNFAELGKDVWMGRPCGV